MPRINLLPHREQKRKERRRDFFVMLGGTLVCAVVVVGCGKLLYAGWTDAQNDKNNLLKKEIVKLDAQIADIQDLENRKQRLLNRMDIIEKLQRQRPEIVHRFDELVKLVPEGVYLTSLKESGKKLEVKGVAQSSTRVSTFMRNIDGSTFLSNPELQVVESAPQSPTGGSSFVLYANEVGVDMDTPSDGVKKVAKQ
ncbi:MAG TPA: PilN domain-containing protein [Steroidobacteraceae bacterium]|jgi:type IV pilus assembly protein PilN